MSNSYREINFEAFSKVPEKKLTKAESRRLIEGFYRKAGCYHSIEKRKRQRHSVAAVCICLIVCLAISPIGNAAWAAVKQAMLGIGEYLGMARQDDYATVVDQTQTKNGITVTLNDAIGSDNELRVSVTAKTDSGEVLGLNKINIGDYSINGLNWRNGLDTTGVGPFGSKRTKDGCIYFLNASFVNYEMPLDPRIDMDIEAGNEIFQFSFVLENEAFKEATRVVDIDKDVIIYGETITLKQLIVTPIDQKITTKNADGAQVWESPSVMIYGVDNSGEGVIFSPNPFGKIFDGYRDNQDEMTYQTNANVSSYTFSVYDLKDADRDDLWNPKNAISEAFTVKF